MSRDRALQASSTDVEQSAGDGHVMHESPYMTSAEAARYLRYASVRALYDAVPTLNIPVCRRGGKTMLFDRRELDRWLRGELRSRRTVKVKPVTGNLKLAHVSNSVDGGSNAR